MLTAIRSREASAVPLRPSGVQTVIVPNMRDALSWWTEATCLRLSSLGHAADVTVVQLSASGRIRSRLNVVSGPGASEYRDVDLFCPFAGQAAGVVKDPWANTVYCLAYRGRLLPLTSSAIERNPLK